LPKNLKARVISVLVAYLNTDNAPFPDFFNLQEYSKSNLSVHSNIMILKGKYEMYYGSIIDLLINSG